MLLGTHAHLSDQRFVGWTIHWWLETSYFSFPIFRVLRQAACLGVLEQPLAAEASHVKELRKSQTKMLKFVAWTRGLRAARIGALSVSIFGQRPQMLWRMLPASLSFKFTSFGPFFRWGVGYSTGASDVLVDPGEFRRKKDGWVAAHLPVWRISFAPFVWGDHIAEVHSCHGWEGQCQVRKTECSFGCVSSTLQDFQKSTASLLEAMWWDLRRISGAWIL